MTATKRIVLFFSIAISLTAFSGPARAQNSFTNVFTDTGFASPGFPFPRQFRAQRAIAVYDTNGNGFLDPAAGQAAVPFPFQYPPLAPDTGRRIGSPFVLPVSGISTGGLGGFCGDILVYAEETVQNTGVTYFVWFGLLDPNRPPKPSTCPFPVDFGMGSFQGTRTNPSNVHSASFVGGSLTSNGVVTGTGHGPLRYWLYNIAGVPANPGHLYSVDPNNSTAAWPGAWQNFVAGEPAADPLQNYFISLNNVVLDVPLISETAWDGTSMFTTEFPITRSISPLTGGGGPASLPSSGSATLWSTAMPDSSGPYSQLQYESIKFTDLDGDGRADLCYRAVPAAATPANSGGIYCAKAIGSAMSGGNRFATPTLWTSGFNSNWSADESYWGTIQYADVSGDGKADVCGRGPDGIWCARSTGTSFAPPSRWSTGFSDALGWKADPSNWKTIRFIDINGDGRADICGRGFEGIWCALSTGSSFGEPSLWSTQFSNANNWQSDPGYWSTIQYADINEDGKADVCGRAAAGIVCAISNGGPGGRFTRGAFINLAVWTTQFSDANGWKVPQYYATIRLADIDGDEKADVCGRGRDGFYCGRSTGTSFIDTNSVHAPEFADDNGWNTPNHYLDTWVVDVNGDGRADICGRGYDSISCALSYSTPGAGSGQTIFAPAIVWIVNFGDNSQWGSSQSYWGTVQPARVDGSATGFCGRGIAGIWCGYFY